MIGLFIAQNDIWSYIWDTFRIRYAQVSITTSSSMNSRSRIARQRSPKIFFPIPSLLLRVIYPAEGLVLLFASLLAAINGLGFPLLPVLFASNIANFSSIYNPNIFSIVNEDENTQLSEAQIISDIQRISRFILFFGVSAALSTFLVAIVQFKITRALGKRIRLKFFSSLWSQDVSWFQSHESADFVARSSRINVIEKFIGQTLLEVIRDTSAVLGGFILSFRSSWRMTLVVISFMPVIGGIGALLSIFLRRESRQHEKAIENASFSSHETFKNFKTVLAFNAEKKEVQLYKNFIEELSRREVRKAFVGAVGTGVLMLTIISCFATGFWFGSQFVQRRTVSLSDAISAASVVPAVFAAFRLANSQKVFASASIVAFSILEVTSSIPKTDVSNRSSIELTGFRGSITFEGVSFIHQPLRKEESIERNEIEQKPDNFNKSPKTILDNVNFHLQAGGSYAIWGSSGTGKSTLLKLLCRFFDVSKGRIVLDNACDIRDVSTNWLRSEVGYVGQEPSLFSGTIRENIAYGAYLKSTRSPNSEEWNSNEVSFERIVSAARVANAHDFIEQLPDKYETVLEEGGTGLSGGQKQRICIARALVGEPTILLLDECTSNLDNESQEQVQKGLEKAAKNCTTIVVSHDVNAIRKCDQVFGLQNGKITDEGAFQQFSQKISAALRETTPKERFENCFSVNSSSEKVDSPPHSVVRKQSTGQYGDLKGCVEENQFRDEAEDSSILKFFQVSRKILSMQKEGHLYLFFALAGAIITGASWPLASAAISELLYIGVSDQFTKEVKKWLLFLFGCGIFAFIGIILQVSFLSVYGENLTRYVRLSTFSRLLEKDLSYFERNENSATSLSLKLLSESALPRELTGDLIGFLTLILASVTTGLAISFYYCWRLALLGLLFMPGILLSGFEVSTLGVQVEAEQDIDSVKLASEVTSMIYTVNSLGLQDLFIKRYQDQINKTGSSISKGSLISAVVQGYIAASPFALFGSSFMLGSFLLKSGTCTFLEFNKSVLSIFLGSVLVGEVTNLVPRFRQADRAARTFLKLQGKAENLVRVSCINTGSEKISGTKKQEAIKFRNVSFSYDRKNNTEILKRFNAEIRHGEKVAIVGPSGSGKSTIFNVLLGFYPQYKGEIYFNNINTREMDPSRLLGNFALVLQEPELFNRTLFENIEYGIPEEVDQKERKERVEMAARVAQIHDFILSLPEGYNTIAGREGELFSGGQRQRVAIARAIARRPSVLLLDEFTSALDIETDIKLRKALKNYFDSLTIIMIAHKLETVKDSDMILFLKGGDLTEQGSHEELLSRNGDYADMYRRR